MSDGACTAGFSIALPEGIFLRRSRLAGFRGEKINFGVFTISFASRRSFSRSRFGGSQTDPDCMDAVWSEFGQRRALQDACGARCGCAACLRGLQPAARSLRCARGAARLRPRGRCGRTRPRLRAPSPSGLSVRPVRTRRIVRRIVLVLPPVAQPGACASALAQLAAPPSDLRLAPARTGPRTRPWTCSPATTHAPARGPLCACARAAKAARAVRACAASSLAQRCKALLDDRLTAALVSTFGHSFGFSGAPRRLHFDCQAVRCFVVCLYVGGPGLCASVDL